MTAAWGDPAAYAVSFGPLCAQTVVDLLAACGPVDSRPFLDVGCGTGTLAAAARRSGWSTVAVDADTGMVGAARAALPGVHVLAGALPELPFADDVMGAVGANFVVNHTDDPAAAVSELARVCRPGGRVALTIWPERLIAVNSLWNEVMVAAGVEPPPPRALTHELDVDRTPRGLEELVRASGLVDVDVRERDVVLRVAPADLWQAAEGGVATIGAVYRSQPAARRAAMRTAYSAITGSRLEDGLLVLPGTALLAAATRAR